MNLGLRLCNLEDAEEKRLVLSRTSLYSLKAISSQTNLANSAFKLI
jgi:hypothetical protein